MWIERSEGRKRALLRVWRRLPLSGRWRGRLYWLLGTKYAVGVLGLIFDAQGRILLLRHTYKGRYPWGLPGGGLARGESTTEAVVREVREEAGLRVRVAGLLGVETHPRRLLVEVYYLCRAEGGTFRPNAEIAACAYFDLAALPPDVEPRLRGLLHRYAAAGQLPPPG